jgi:hypothetical protein
MGWARVFEPEPGILELWRGLASALTVSCEGGFGLEVTAVSSSSMTELERTDGPGAWKSSLVSSVAYGWQNLESSGDVRCYVVPDEDPQVAVVYFSGIIELNGSQRTAVGELIAAELPGILVLSGQSRKVRRQLELAMRAPTFDPIHLSTFDFHEALIMEELNSIRDRIKLRIVNLLSQEQNRRPEEIEVTFLSQ